MGSLNLVLSHHHFVYLVVMIVGLLVGYSLLQTPGLMGSEVDMLKIEPL